MQPSFDRQRVYIGPHTLTYVEANRSSSLTPIVLLHGWGISAEPYQEILTLLAQSGHPVIAPDLPGLAGSSPPAFSNRYTSYAEQIIAFLIALNLDAVHLIGHSLGGGISIVVSAFAPERVRSLILVNSTGIPIGSVPNVLLRRAIEMPLQISLPKLKLQLVDIPKAFAHNLIARLPLVIDALLVSLHQDLQPYLSKIEAPCLLLWSRQDMTTPLTVAEQFARQIKSARLIVSEEGFHEWCLLYPQKFAAIVMEFIEDSDAKERSATDLLERTA